MLACLVCFGLFVFGVSVRVIDCVVCLRVGCCFVVRLLVLLLLLVVVVVLFVVDCWWLLLCVLAC